MTDRSCLFLHGSPGSSGSWAPLLDLAPAGARCEAWDLLDHGERDAPDATLDDTVADVVERVRAFDRPITLVGHSFGAWVGARALASLGERVERFVPIAGLPRVPAELAERSLGFAAALESGQLPVAGAVQAAAAIWLSPHDPDPRHVARIAELLESDRVERLARILRRQAGVADPAQHVQPYATRTTAIHCTGDRGVSIELGRELVAIGASARMVELDGDDHFPHWTRPAVVAEVVFGE